MIDRFARTPKIKDGAISRARRLRADPTFTEAKLWKQLRKLDVRVRRQAPIGPYVVDFACLPARIVIEVDGGVHNLPDVALRDAKRDAWLAMQGYRVLRIPSKQVEDDIGMVVALIRSAIQKALPPRGGKGWVGGGGTGDAETLDDSALPATDEDRVSADHGSSSASTPTQPSPLEGEGFSEA